MARSKPRAAAWIAAALACTRMLAAAEPPRVHALVGARVVVAPGKTLDRATVVLRDGVIAGAGQDLKAPADARVWDTDGLTLYPGLIDAYTVRNVQQIRDEKAQNGQPSRLVRAERDITPYAADEDAFKKLRELGFTITVVAPKDGLFRGRSTLVALGSGPLERVLLRRAVAQNVTVKPNRDDEEAYPGSMMGAVALFRQTMLDARWQAEALAAYGRNPRQARPPDSPALAALGDAAAGKETVVFETEDVLDTLRDAALAREFGLRAWIVGNGHEYRRIDEIKATGLPHILPLAFPKAPKPSGTEDPNVELAALRHWDRAPDNPKILIGSGLRVAFTTSGLDDASKFPANLAQSIERGLTADQALAALTVTPAELLGIADRAGTIEPGKMANLIEVEGDLFVEKPKIRAVWIDGERYEIQDAKAGEADPNGAWTLSLEMSDGSRRSARLEIDEQEKALKGTVAVDDRKVELDSVKLSGKRLAATFDGSVLGVNGKVTLQLDLDGDRITGSAESPDGSLAVSGERVKKPAEVVE